MNIQNGQTFNGFNQTFKVTDFNSEAVEVNDQTVYEVTFKLESANSTRRFQFTSKDGNVSAGVLFGFERVAGMAA